MQTGISNALDVMTFNKAKRARGTLTTIWDHGVWTNCPVLTHRLLQEKERRAWSQSRGINTRKEIQWGEVFHEALKTQVKRREPD